MTNSNHFFFPNYYIFYILRFSVLIISVLGKLVIHGSLILCLRFEASEVILYLLLNFIYKKKIFTTIIVQKNCIVATISGYNFLDFFVRERIALSLPENWQFYFTDFGCLGAKELHGFTIAG